MNQKKLQEATSLFQVAQILHLKPKGLSYLLYKFNAPKYIEFEIDKKSGEKRKIKSPHPKISKLQKKVLKVLNDIYIPQKCVQGFVKKKSSYNKNHVGIIIKDKQKKEKSIPVGIITNAKLHSSKKYVVSIDIKDFFPSINFGRVRGMFLSKPYQFSPIASTIFAQIACDNNELPVGSPCSPIIANMVAEHLDYDIMNYIIKSKCQITYTRYADDMTFSFNNEKYLSYIFDTKLNKISDGLLNIIEKNGFKVQNSKSRIRTSNQRQETTGLVCNLYPNVKKEYFRKVRNMVHKFYHNQSEISENSICGSLAFLYNIKNTEKNKSKTNVSTFTKLFFKFNLGKINKRYFDGAKLVILTEGATDTIYYQKALDKYLERNKDLKELQKKIKFINLFHGTQGSGTPQLNNFINIINLNKISLTNKIVILVDNDKDGRSVLENIKKANNEQIIGLTFDEKYKTIEDLFNKQKEESTSRLLSTYMKEKNYKNEKEALKNHKSRALAKDFIKHYDIDFSNFDHIFEKIIENIT